MKIMDGRFKKIKPVQIHTDGESIALKNNKLFADVVSNRVESSRLCIETLLLLIAVVFLSRISTSKDILASTRQI